VAAVWLAGALLAQATLVHYLGIRDVTPSLVLVVVVWYAVRVDARRAAIYGLLAGLCEDVLAAQTGAAWTISTGLTALLTSMLSRGFFADSVPIIASMTAVATLLRALFFWTVMSLEGYPPGLAPLHARHALIEAVLNLAIMAVAMLIARRYDTRSA
jgi:rod shape-determining protein MreD